MTLLRYATNAALNVVETELTMPVKLSLSIIFSRIGKNKSPDFRAFILNFKKQVS